ncbi:hypothetical protein [Bacillus cereus]
MTLSIQYEFHLFAKELQRYLSPSILQKLVQEKGFVKHNISIILEGMVSL